MVAAFVGTPISMTVSCGDSPYLPTVSFDPSAI